MTIAAIKHIEIIDTKTIRIVDTPITVAEIVTMHLVNESPIEWIAENYDLSRAQIHAALAYYYDHQMEIDGLMPEQATRTRQLLAEMGISHEQLIKKLTGDSGL